MYQRLVWCLFIPSLCKSMLVLLVLKQTCEVAVCRHLEGFFFFSMLVLDMYLTEEYFVFCSCGRLKQSAKEKLLVLSFATGRSGCPFTPFCSLSPDTRRQEVSSERQRHRLCPNGVHTLLCMLSVRSAALITHKPEQMYEPAWSVFMCCF